MKPIIWWYKYLINNVHIYDSIKGKLPTTTHFILLTISKGYLDSGQYLKFPDRKSLINQSMEKWIDYGMYIHWISYLFPVSRNGLYYGHECPFNISDIFVFSFSLNKYGSTYIHDRIIMIKSSVYTRLSRFGNQILYYSLSHIYKEDTRNKIPISDVFVKKKVSPLLSKLNKTKVIL